MAYPVPLYPYKLRLPAPIYWVYRAIRTLGCVLCADESPAAPSASTHASAILDAPIIS